MLALAIAGVVRLIVPVPTLRSVAAVWLIAPPVVLPPVLVSTVKVPLVEMSRSAAVPVPPPAAFTLTFTPPVFVVVSSFPRSS